MNSLWSKIRSAFNTIIHGGKTASTNALKNRLAKMVMGDHGTVERLIEHERKIKPDAPESELISAAIDRLRRDRG
ncbi:hypothetical protein [Desulfobulbus alkaliphilus]|uniref:hypothetical protein n=1 Tax=Desulfobulbus alkaliphilus TaxID=869814 RepID=UPI0019627042|nr:hypothetical protein [Desulfobulbus alkaliphilus]MBM9537803.1 hypothetical protein [Desulfobulbus alkaliphilus]